MPVPLAICIALGLTAETTEAQAVSAINQLKDDKSKALNRSNNPSLEKFVPRADHDAALNRAQEAENKLKQQEQAALNQQIDDELNKALKAGVITPSTVDYHRACCLQDGGLDRFKAYTEAAPEIGADSDLDNKPPKANNSSLTEDKKAACHAMGISEDDFRQAKEIQ